VKDLEALTPLQLQTTLLKSSISYVQSVSGSLILRTTLNNILETLIKYTDADDGSIFLISEDGSITESILARGPAPRDCKDKLISRVLEEGLAGWSIRHQQIGIIHDATKDDRWLQLTDQPYTAHSAIALPLFYGLEIIGMITLSHELPHHFDERIEQLLKEIMEGIAAIVVNAQIHAEYRPLGLI
jgi:transcriptional regulator with GAF, ATPase, and Fis domain